MFATISFTFQLRCFVSPQYRLGQKSKLNFALVYLCKTEMTRRNIYMPVCPAEPYVTPAFGYFGGRPLCGLEDLKF